MKFERLTVPQWQIPDLVAFNQRVRERIEPFWQRKWVRRGTWTALGLFLFFSGVWLYFASGLPSSEKLLAYEPPLPTNVRGYDGDLVQTFARERRVELAYDEFPPLVVNAFISAEDKTFFSHGGIDYAGLIAAVADFTTKSVTGGGRARIEQPMDITRARTELGYTVRGLDDGIRALAAKARSADDEA